jgi:hypothetical protein
MQHLSPPDISVVCLSYNQGKYIERAIQSVLAQSAADFELIVVDDGSSDDTLRRLKSLSDHRIRVRPQKNLGPSAASLRGVSEARGRLIALMCADDVLDPGRLEQQREFLDRCNHDIVFSRPTLIDDNDQRINDEIRSVFFKPNFASEAELLRRLFDSGNFLCAPSAMLRREVVERHGWVRPGLLYLQDFELWLRLASTCRIGLSEARLTRYRIRGDDGNLSAQRNKLPAEPEMLYIYNHALRGVSVEFLQQAFPEAGFSHEGTDRQHEMTIVRLLLSHSKAVVRSAGVQRAIALAGSSAELVELENFLGLCWADILGLAGKASTKAKESRRQSLAAKLGTILSWRKTPAGKKAQSPRS